MKTNKYPDENRNLLIDLQSLDEKILQPKVADINQMFANNKKKSKILVNKSMG